MISHAEVDMTLAKAWFALLRRLFPDAEIWYSTKPDAFPSEKEESIVEKVRKEIDKAQHILTIQTPFSSSRAWILWELGLAYGARKSVFVAAMECRLAKSACPLTDIISTHRILTV
jgi:hypothetical protein